MATQSQPQADSLPEVYESILADPKVAARFWAKVNKVGPIPVKRPDLGPCWLWMGSKGGDGYGRLGMPPRRPVLAHRLAYESVNGPIPPRLESDHLCRTRACVRPSHLEAVSHRENMRRGYQATKPNCKQGHPFDRANTYRLRGHRTCRKCNRLAVIRYLQNKQASPLRERP